MKTYALIAIFSNTCYTFEAANDMDAGNYAIAKIGTSWRNLYKLVELRYL